MFVRLLLLPSLKGLGAGREQMWAEVVAAQVSSLGFVPEKIQLSLQGPRDGWELIDSRSARMLECGTSQTLACCESPC